MNNPINELPLVARVTSFDYGANAAFLTELHSVFKKHKMLDRLGLCLLHRHFDLGEDEVLVESVDVQSRQGLVCPKHKASLVGQEQLETMWKLEEDGQATILQYCGRCS